MKKNLFPNGDKKFLEFTAQNTRALETDGASYGLDAAEVAVLTAAFNDYRAAANERRAARDAARVSKVKKEVAQKELKKILSGYFARIRAARNVSDTKIVALGLKPIDRIRTAVKAPDDAPEFDVEIVRSAAHYIRFWETGSARRRRKPNGVVGAEIYVSFDADKNNFDNYVLKTIASRSPHLFKHDRSDIGKQAHFYLRWLTTRGETSKPSRIATATVTS